MSVELSSTRRHPLVVHGIECSAAGLVAQGAQLVDVLPAREFAEERVPGARNLPLKELNAATARQLDRERPVIVTATTTSET